MEYDFPLFRPPSEARSLIFQVTLGCSWNRCRFCASYRTKEFLVRPFEEVKRDIDEMSGRYPDVRKIFLADGDPMAAPTDYLVKVLDLMNRRFPSLERISTYAGPTNLMGKTPEELKMLKERKLDLLYLGIETGNDELLKRIGKGATAGQIVEESRKALQAGLRISAFIILGLGGVDGSLEHAKDSARVVNAIAPQFLATLTLIPLPDARTYEVRVIGRGFRLIDPVQSLRELRWFVEDLELSGCKFGTEHASNYLSITGMALPGDKDEILRRIDKALIDASPDTLRPEWMRGL